MSDVVLRVEHLYKQYRLGAVNHKSLRDDMAKIWAKICGRPDPTQLIAGENTLAGQKVDNPYVWALQDINFEINRGDVVGVIGKNGAGKSTLLKILSKTTAPTKGEVKIKGRIASLLEVGTGFHGELTGRENIFLNGAILGMSKAEIRKKLEEIIHFAGVEKYIDTPVKRYSSGMYVRLAFAVAAYLDPDILIVDEVLAVGDADFQEKCIGKMKDVSVSEGRTVMVVSHNIQVIKSLCKKGIFLKEGTLVASGAITDVVGQYLYKYSTTSVSGVIADDASTINTGQAKFRKIEMLNKAGAVTNQVYYCSPLRLRISVEVFEKLKDAVFDVKITTKDGMIITYSATEFADMPPLTLTPGMHTFEVEVDSKLQPGSYSLAIGIHRSEGSTIDYLENIYDFTILELAEDTQLKHQIKWVHGYLRAESRWKFN